MGRLIVSTQLTVDGVIDVGEWYVSEDEPIVQARISLLRRARCSLGARPTRVLLPTGRRWRMTGQTNAESMQHHLEVMGEKVRETFAFADFESLEIYGEPNDALKEWLPRVSEGIAFTFHPLHWGGFTRLQGITSD
jgi:hypothetical protein